ncbi:MAG: helix-turn-helix domain-containing protein [Anaeromyxobacter sp.]
MARPPRPHVRDALLEAARAEFSRHGLERARVEDITRAAGASKGAFYLHFTSKEQAFEEIIQRFLGAMEDQAHRREEAEAAFLREHDGEQGEALARTLVAFDCRVDLGILETLWRNRHLFAVVEGAAATRYQRLLAEFRHRMRAFVVARVEGHQRAGRVRPDVDPTVIADLLVGAYEGFARRMVGARAQPDLAGWLRSLVTALYEGLLHTPAAAPAKAARAARPRRTAAARTR